MAYEIQQCIELVAKAVMISPNLYIQDSKYLIIINLLTNSFDMGLYFSFSFGQEITASSIMLSKEPIQISK